MVEASGETNPRAERKAKRCGGAIHPGNHFPLMKNEGPWVLVVADRTAARRLLRERAQAAFPGGVVQEACTADEALTMLRRRDYEIILAEQAVGLESGEDVLEVAAREHPWTMRVLVGGNGGRTPARVHAVLPPDAPTEKAAEALRNLLAARD